MLQRWLTYALTANAAPKSDPIQSTRFRKTGELQKNAKISTLVNYSLETPQVISPAFAQAAGAGGVQDALSQFLPLIAMFAILYFLMIRPQMKKAKEHKALVAGLQKGDEVITQGGMAGKVTQIGDNYIKVEVGTNSAGPVEITVQRPAIGIVLPKGTLGSL